MAQAFRSASFSQALTCQPRTFMLAVVEVVLVVVVVVVVPCTCSSRIHSCTIREVRTCEGALPKTEVGAKRQQLRRLQLSLVTLKLGKPHSTASQTESSQRLQRQGLPDVRDLMLIVFQTQLYFYKKASMLIHPLVRPQTAHCTSTTWVALPGLPSVAHGNPARCLPP